METANSSGDGVLGNSGTSSASDSHNEPMRGAGKGLLTVKAKAKVKEYEEQQAASHRPSTFVWIVVKWLLTALISLGFLTCLVFSKVSAIKLAQELHKDINETSMAGSDAKQPIALVLLIVSTCTPYVVGSVMAAWSGLFRHDVPWPSPRAICIGLLCGTCEVVGVCIYTVIVIPRLLDEGHFSMVLMNSILFLPIIKHALYDPCRQKYLQGMQRRRGLREGESALPGIPARTMALYWVALAFQIGGQVILAWHYIGGYQSDEYDMETKLCLVSSLLLVSLAWLPALQKMQLRPSASTQISDRPVHSAAGAQTGEDPDSISALYRSRHKACFIANIYKLLLTPAVAILIVLVRERIGAVGAFPVESLRLAVWEQFSMPASAATIDWFSLNIVSSFVGYVLGLLACMMCMQLVAFALPLTLATPLALTTCYLISRCKDGLRPYAHENCQMPSSSDIEDVAWVVGAAVCLWVAQILSTVVDIFRSQPIVMEKEGNLFWLSGYSSIFLEQGMMLGRRTYKTDELRDNPVDTRKRIRVFICTTMYREEEHEMEQLLVSLAAVNNAQLSQKNFEAHIFFDNGVKGKKLTEFALQLVSLVGRTLGVKLTDCTKVTTPYGISLSWQLPGAAPGTSGGMRFTIHLKDNLKVKNKKRWSQIMYMSMVLDYILPGESRSNDMESFILTTDADVKFNRDSVEVLLDLMMRNSNVGAVCARTYPMGSGPLVWYQIFDYAIGHWFQKAAEHVMGTVLCCPGCFSVYRMKALRQVVPLYASKVNQASEFLTKDMGEDRWLCTLMVQAGWRLEYSAVAVDGTHCPEEFEEFYKQRRRWIPSTLANQVLLLQEWSLARALNNNVSVFFLFYQLLLIFSTLITPAMTILVVSGGLEYGWGVPSVATIVIMLLVIIGYAFICLKLHGDTQLLVAKWLTFIFAIIMSAVAIGIAVQVVGELTGSTCVPPHAPSTTASSVWLARDPQPYQLHAGNYTNSFGLAADGNQSTTPGSTRIPPCQYTPVVPGTAINFSTLYLAVLVGMYLVTGLLHPSEMYCLIHGLWYLLCLPSGYLFLMVYSLCNITDNSWGTREDKSKVTVADDSAGSLRERIRNVFSSIFFCCQPAKPEAQAAATPAAQPVAEVLTQVPRPSSSCRRDSVLESDRPISRQCTEVEPLSPDEERTLNDDAEMETFHFPGDRPQLRQQRAQLSSYLATEEWLRDIDPHFEELYAHKFKADGYTDTSFIAGISDADLKALRVDNEYHRKVLLDTSKYLEEPDVDVIVPKDPSEWLHTLALSEYTQVFKLNHIRGEKGLERLKNMKQKEIEQILKIRKRGHMRRLLQGVLCLRYPTERENRIRAARAELDQVPTNDLKVVNPEEAEFWEELRQACLLPEPVVFGLEGELKSKLVGLRNSTLMAFVVTNTLWLILMLTLDFKVSLYINGANPLGVSFLFVFGIVMAAQFLSMIFHRITTALHIVARAPFLSSKPWNSGFSFGEASQEDHLQPVTEAELQRVREETMRNRHNRGSHHINNTETTPLLSDSTVYGRTDEQII